MVRFRWFWWNFLPVRWNLAAADTGKSWGLTLSRGGRWCSVLHSQSRSQSAAGQVWDCCSEDLPPSWGPAVEYWRNCIWMGSIAWFPPRTARGLNAPLAPVLRSFWTLHFRPRCSFQIREATCWSFKLWHQLTTKRSVRCRSTVAFHDV